MASVEPKFDSLYVRSDFTSKISNKEYAKVVIELGARDCVDTELLEQIYPNAKIYAIECNPNQIQICKENLKKTNIMGCGCKKRKPAPAKPKPTNTTPPKPPTTSK